MSKTTRNPVKYVTKKQLKRAGVYLDDYPSCGPWPNVTGIRKKYYGLHAPLLRHGAYVYHVPQKIYDKFSHRGY